MKNPSLDTKKKIFKPTLDLHEEFPGNPTLAI